MKLIILDRDGVINQDSDAFIKSPDEFIPIPGSLEAIARLNQAGYTIVVATNQSGIARGMYDESMLEKMHDKLHGLLEPIGGKIERIYFCPHGPTDDCDCRKPKPGMLRQILKDYPVTDAGDVIAIGDSLRDLQAAQQVGVKSIAVRTGKGQKTVQQLPDHDELKDTPVYADLDEAVTVILKTE